MDNPQMKTKYGLATAIAMVVGVVAGSGVFFKAEAVLSATGGDVRTGVTAWILVGLVMIICAGTFAVLASRYERAASMVDFADIVAGSDFSFFLGWFLATIYYPSLTAILAWVTARYICVFFHTSDLLGGTAILFTAFILILLFVVNSLAPRFSGRMQVVSTIAKLLPLICMAIFGIISGLNSGMLARNFYTATPATGEGGLLAAIISVAFAYEGWIVSTSINGELKNAKRNMPLALTAGTLIIMGIYVFYYIGLTGAVTTRTLMESGHQGAFVAFETIFGTGMGTAVFALIVVSCFSTCNGLCVANSRALYALAARNHLPSSFATLDPNSNMPLTSSTLSMLLAMVWLVHFYGSHIEPPWFPHTFRFDSSELPIITLYAFYIPMFLCMMKKEKDLRFFSRFILPGLATLCCILMVITCMVVHSSKIPGYFIVFAIDMALGAFVLLRKKKVSRVRTEKDS